MIAIVCRCGLPCRTCFRFASFCCSKILYVLHGLSNFHCDELLGLTPTQWWWILKDYSVWWCDSSVHSQPSMTLRCLNPDRQIWQLRVLDRWGPDVSAGPVGRFDVLGQWVVFRSLLFVFSFCFCEHCQFSLMLPTWCKASRFQWNAFWNECMVWIPSVDVIDLFSLPCDKRKVCHLL